MREFSKSILFCDDNAAFIRIIAESIIDNGDESILKYLLFADNVDKALEIYMEKRPMIVFMDLRLDGKNGIEGSQMIKDYDPDAHITLLTNYPDDPDAACAIQKNLANGVFDKGVGSTTLASMVGFIVKVLVKVA